MSHVTVTPVLTVVLEVVTTPVIICRAVSFRPSTVRDRVPLENAWRSLSARTLSA